MGVFRSDRGELRKPVRLDNGYLRVDAYLTRAGVFTYRRTRDGATTREYRPPDEVFNTDSVASFDLMPVTNDHPPVGLLTPGNTHQFQVGTVGAPAREDSKMRGSIMLTDAKVIAAVEKGKTQISLGYVCDLEMTSGVTPDGEKYDAIQRNIRGNHAAIVDVGRAGPEIRVKMDTEDAAMLASDSAISPPDALEPEPMKRKIKLDSGTEIEVDEAVAVLFEQTQAKGDAQRARADAAEKQVASLTAQLAEAPAKALAAATARAALESKAKEIVGAEASFDGKDDNAVRLAVIEKLAGEMPEGKSAAYVEARFDAELAAHARVNPALAALRVASSNPRSDSTTPPAPGSGSPTNLVAAATAKYNAALATK